MPSESYLFVLCKSHSQTARNFGGYIVFDSEDVRHLPLVLLSPQLRPVSYSYELGCYDQDVASLENSSGQDGSDVQISADLHRINVFSLVAKNRTTGDHSQMPELSKVVNQTFCNAIGEVLRIG